MINKVKVLFKDGDNLRIIKGKILSEDNFFIELDCDFSSYKSLRRILLGTGFNSKLILPPNIVRLILPAEYNIKIELPKKIIEKSEEKNLCFVTMTQYNKTFTCRVAFPPIGIDTTLAAEVSKAGLTQAHIAETEKYPHATYFLNGGKQDPHTGEEHILIESRKDVQTHDLAPKMRAKEIADKALEQLEQKTDFIFINFANADMVGHTANQPAILEAVEEVDRQLQRVVEATHIQNGVVFITADHGNAEVMIDPVTGEKHTAHTTNLVPGILTDTRYTLRESGTLADITPTILSLFNIKQPESMTGANLLIS